jgi:hypothetical protein
MSALHIGVTGHRRLHDTCALAERVEQALATVRALAASTGDLAPRLAVLSSLAEGADRLVAAVVLRQPGAQLEAMLPLPPDDYRGDFATDASRHEFDRLLARARRTTIAPPLPSRDAAYAHAGRQVVARCDVLVALWDGLPARGQGGTAEIVEEARARGVPLIWIHTAPPFTVRMERLDAIGARMAARAADQSASPEA